MLSRKKRWALVLEHQYLASAIARRYTTNSTDYLDLLQEGNIGLIKAAEKFDPKRPTKFSTMAVPWVKKFIRQAAMNRNLVRVPLNQQWKKQRINRLSNRIFTRTGVSVLLPFENFDHTPVRPVEQMADDSAIDASETACDQENYAAIGEATGQLSDLELSVLQLRCHGRGSKEVGLHHHFSKQRALQLYNKAIRKIQRHITESGSGLEFVQ